MMRRSSILVARNGLSGHTLQPIIPNGVCEVRNLSFSVLLYSSGEML